MLKPGGEIDSWCGTCKMMLAHTIEAMVGEKPARVHCNTCQAQHGFKPYKPGEAPKKAAAKKAGGSLIPRSGKVRANQYQTLLNGTDMATVKPYSPKNSYTAGEVMDHPSFGLGITTTLKDGAKIEVLFEGGVKLLVHGR